MPLEMFDGKTGPRLIARLPVVDGSYAEIKTDHLEGLKVFSPPGLMSNGYPAFSPILSSMPTFLAVPIEARRQALRNEHDRFELQLDREMLEAWRIIDNKDASLGAALNATFAHINTNLWRAMLERTRPMVEKLPICTSIGVGRRLSLKLPKDLFKELSTIELGTVEEIVIHNAREMSPHATA